ncbi:hypothetical protein PTQ21_27015 [Paenibacillus marchantiae]|uniref:hypothetical protein n=1 Tax=Paenibacillus marchantiae TaxID=3026433 RepID=UPI00237A9AB8|nr:hypothetical protein [Paenibacillus marchantiae]WDQ32000.1 hypothetical protein PTQ21_27015 [Paenibacillus marchantiae]
MILRALTRFSEEMRQMSGWKKIKKYLIADLSEGPTPDEPFSLGHWNTENKRDTSQPSSWGR